MIWTPEKVRELLDTSDKAVEHAILRIYERQTCDEQASLSTTHKNGMGFSGADAEFGSNMAKWLLKGYHLTPKQLPYARKISKKYVRQLCKVIGAKND